MALITYFDPIVSPYMGGIGTPNTWFYDAGFIKYPAHGWANPIHSGEAAVSWGSWLREEWDTRAPDVLVGDLGDVRPPSDAVEIHLAGDTLSDLVAMSGGRSWPESGILEGFDMRHPDGTLSVTVSGLSVDVADLNAPHTNPYQQAIALIGGGDDRILGSESGERADGYHGNDNISLFGGNDLGFGGHGHDTVRGGDGDDRLFGGSGNDLVAGEGGNDKLHGGTGNDTLDGGPGLDMVMYHDVPSFPGDSLYINLEAGISRNRFGTDELRNIEFVFGSALKDVIYGTNAHDNVLSGGGHDDSIYGLAGDDQIRGNEGNDVLRGGSGNDYIVGGAGNDILEGGQGADTMHGGYGDDTFVFRALGHIGVTTEGRDNIGGDRWSGNFGDDTIDLSAIDADPSNPQDDAFINAGEAFTGQAGELIIRSERAPTNQRVWLVEIDADGDGVRDAQIFTGTWAVNVDDILL